MILVGERTFTTEYVSETDFSIAVNPYGFRAVQCDG